MPSTSRHTSAYAARSLLLIAMSSFGSALPSLTYEGCFSSSQPLKDLGSYTYQTSGYCQQQCTNQNQAVLGLSGGSDCWCGGQIPSASSKVDDTKCNSPCDGFDQDYCGGDGYYSVYLTGTTDNVPTFGGSSSDSTPSGTPSQTRPTPSIVTSVSPGKTVVITATSTPSGSSSASSSGSGGGSNTTAIAAGVVVGVVLAISAIAAVFFWLRHKRRRSAEDEYKRTQISDFMRGGGDKPPNTGYSQASDARLDPEAGIRRTSVGSIADNQDYSRKILRVANPDRS